MSKEIIAYVKFAHGTFNAFVFTLFLYQGFLGTKIRRLRDTGSQKRHRKLGPIAALLGISGFFAGMTLVYFDAGRVMKYPLHFISGLALASLITATYFISRKIKGPDTYWRDRHYAVGRVILLLYVLQVFLGLGVLL